MTMLRSFLVLTSLAMLFAACGSTTGQVRRGDAWDNASTAVFDAAPEDVRGVVKRWLSDEDFDIDYEDDGRVVKGYKSGSIAKQNVEMRIAIEEGPGPETTRVKVISGRSLGLEGFATPYHDKLLSHLRDRFPPQAAGKAS